jgi:hypothetical protein
MVLEGNGVGVSKQRLWCKRLTVMVLVTVMAHPKGNSN